MASIRNALAICDTCGFQYPHRVMRLNSYGLLVCPTDFEGGFDLKNDPHEEINIVTLHPEIVEQFEKIIIDITNDNQNQIKTKQLTKEEENRIELELRRLGYI